ncbi:MAG: hypothetical protein A2218_01765 [Elusimicrobia bacterium RIFOXYA2_FULL_53_38]|nr:MAG: hypothetical protein A2218_01765 [Elusimicrobia bacterium RIFOXYA2_FULL_53_38]
MKILVNILVGSLAVIVTAKLLPGVTVDNFGAAIAVAAFWGIVSALVAPTPQFLRLSVNLKNSVEFFPSRSSGALRAAYTLENLARIALGFRPAAAGNPAFFCLPDLPMETKLNCRIRVNLPTLGLVTFVITGLLVMLAAEAVRGFHVAGFRWALAFALVLSAINAFFHRSSALRLTP